MLGIDFSVVVKPAVETSLVEVSAVKGGSEVAAVVVSKGNE